MGQLLIITQPSSRPEPVRSFIVIIYDGDYEELARDQLPISVVAPFGNRLFREVLPGQLTKVREPWYNLVHYYTPEYQRSEKPVGPTSVYGQLYDPETEAEPRIHLHPGAFVQYFVVRLLDYQEELYKGVYSVDDIFLHGAHNLLHHHIQQGELSGDKGPYYYAILPSSRALYSASSDFLPEDAYHVQGVFRLPPRPKDETSIFFKPVPPPPPPERDPTSFGEVQMRGKGEPQAGQVFIPRRLYDELRQNLRLSQRNEEGGYALGHVYRLPGSPDREEDSEFRWLVEVTDLLMAEDTIGTPVMLLFTGNTWSKVRKRRARDHADREMVSWFHTHVFPASDTFGLSGLDQDMHAWYLPRPWQTAILLNLEDDGTRTVRCYQRGPQGELVETPFAVFEEA